MMKHNTKYSILSVAAALTVAAFGSCQREELTVNNPAGNDNLNFSVGFAGNGEIVLSKGATLTSQDGTVSIPLSSTVTDGINVNLPGADESAKATKGTQINSETEMLAAKLKSFTAAGWNEDKSEFIPTSTTVSYTDGLWQTAGTYRWRGSDNKVFLAYANLPTSGAAVLNSADPVKQTFTYTVPTDARQQNDVMLGWYEGDGDGTSTAAITMVHPLTAVVFKKGVIDENVTAIKSISIKGVYVNGTADVTYDLPGSDVVPAYNWGSSRTGSQTVTLSPAAGATELEVAEDGKIGTSFIILPQTVAEGTLTLTITVVKDGAEAELSAYVPAGKWEEGKTNTFTIGYTPTYHVTYNLNGVSDSAPVDSESYESGSSATVLAPEGTPTKDDLYTFIRWNTADDGSGKVYYPGDNIVITGNVTLYAQYSSTLARGDSFNTAVGYAINVTFGNYNTYSSIVGPWENGTGTGDGSKSESIRIFKLNDNKDVYVLSKGVIYFGEDCHDMFLGKTLLQSIDFGSNVIDTRNVTQFRCMFSRCSNLTTLDLSDFDTRGAGTQVNDNGKIFENCSNLETIYVGERWDLYTRTNSSDNAECFTGCTSLVGGNGTTYSDSHKGIDYARIDGQGGNPGYLTRSE